MRICFILIVAGVLQAAEGPPQSTRTVSVVRADPKTGRLVRSVIVTPRTVTERPMTGTAAVPQAAPSTAVPSGVPAPKDLEQAVVQVAARHELPPELLDSVIRVESNFNPNAVSPKGAQGLMQLIPATARRFGVDNVFNPIQNLEGGARYLKYLLNLYSGDSQLALAAYNAGENAVARYGGVPPYRETRNYLLLVKQQLDKALGVAHPAKPAPAAAADGPAHIEEIQETDGSVRYVSRR